MCQGYADNSKVNRELMCYMPEGKSFTKVGLELGILHWMPFGVSDPARCNYSLVINPTLILLA